MFEATFLAMSAGFFSYSAAKQESESTLATCNMGPIMQERTASTAMKRVVSKEKIRVKTTENTAAVASSKKGNKMRKAASQMENGLPGPGQDKDTVTTAQRAAHTKRSRFKSGTPGNTSKLTSPVDEANVRPQLRQHRKEEKRENQRITACSTELHQNRGAAAKNRRALSLPISPISGLRHMQMQPLTPSQMPSAEALRRHYTQKEDDTDSASDLSDSERLPVLPSPCTPCTPPHLNLRAEVISTNDFPPDIPGPQGLVGDEDEGEEPVYSYPDFLPPPFNSWSLRQLAVFLHTEGRGAPRPKPVGPLEKYLERLLQLEWLQIQTINAENSRPPGARTRPQSFPAAATAHPQRPHTAPSSRLNSPKGFRQNQRSFPANNPPSPASSAAHHQLSRLPVCPHCHNRFPICNGSCSSYAYQRHSRLSPLLERRAPAKRSSSETRETSKEVKSPGGGGHTPVSPSAAKSHLRHMQATGNARRPLQESAARAQVRRRVRASSETDVKKEPAGMKATAAAEKRASASNKKEVGASKKTDKDWQRTEAGTQTSKTCVKRGAKEQPPVTKASLSSKPCGKTKNVQFVEK